MSNERVTAEDIGVAGRTQGCVIKGIRIRGINEIGTRIFTN
jgi:hypothetical protein